MSIRVFCFLAFSSVVLVKAFPAKDSLEDLIAVESSQLEVKALGEESIDTSDEYNSDEENISTKSHEEDVSEGSNENATSASDESSTEENSESSKEDESENETEMSSEDNVTESKESNDTEESNETEESSDTEDSENSDESYKPDYSEESDSDNFEYEDSEDNNNKKDVPVLPGLYNMNFFTEENGVVTICTQLVNIETREAVSLKCHVAGLSPPSYVMAPPYVGVPHPLLSNGFIL